jgi:MerR family transcriptional regulator, light-induced transcriptional regulator
MRLQEAANMIGVHYQTAYGWVRDGKLPARMVAGGYEVSDRDVRALMARRQTGSKPSSQIQVRDWGSQASRLYQAIIEGQETAARRAMDRLAGHVTMTDLCDRVIAPALRRVGAEWESGLVSVAREHRATAICERLIAMHSPHPAGRPRGTAIAATPQNERHAVPALMAAACLREHHWQVHHLAADLPTAEISVLGADVGANLVVLSTASDSGLRQAQETASQLRASLPASTVLIGRSGDTLAGLVSQVRHLMS